MRGATAQDPPTDRLQTRVCSGLHQQQVCTLAHRGEFNSHPLPVQTPHSKRWPPVFGCHRLLWSL